MEFITNKQQYQHIVLIHGICHGAWCWYKLITHLKSSTAASSTAAVSGRRVTALDLGGCGIDSRRLDEVVSVSDYVKPMMEFFEGVPRGERVVLVCHSYGGIAGAMAMERFPEKIAVAVFAAAYMPNTTVPPGFLVEEYFRRTSEASLMDCKFNFDEGLQNPPTAIFGPNYMANTLYKGCPSEDLELAKMLIRPSRLYVEEMKEIKLTEERYGVVKRVYVVCKEDEVMKEDFQRFMIHSSSLSDDNVEVMVMDGAPHMFMLSMPNQFCLLLGEISNKYP